MTDQTPHPPSGEPLMTEQGTLTKGDMLLVQFRATDADRYTDNAFYQRVLATYHAHAALKAENDSLRATVEGWQTVALKAEQCNCPARNVLHYKECPCAAITQNEGREE